ncbi:conserved hypothetical protein [Rubrivivax sp. A210]|uniref:hypothetical protein n=1 Tax=Rubrivivax sp. A210 TaxID=2772301 RepID=UPI001918B6D5|nr:hypothetical protein [Rubrivivax sp. A210]CAD5366612.1 conserved hypothetical protein [Rubrivivax sp. A210]
MFMLEEQSDVFIDAMASDHHAQLLFVSAYGRDTSIQQFMARLHQSSKDGGVDNLTAMKGYGQKPALRVLVGDPKRLEKSSGRLARTGLLGNLVHVWIFDPAVLAVDHACRSAWILDTKADREGQLAEAWRLIKELSPVPLLDDWMTPVIEHIQQMGGFALPPCIGHIHACRVEVHEAFSDWVSRSLREGHLAVPGTDQAPALLAA